MPLFGRGRLHGASQSRGSVPVNARPRLASSKLWEIEVMPACEIVFCIWYFASLDAVQPERSDPLAILLYGRA